MPRLTKIYTRQGDSGTTSLDSKQRVPKDALRVAAYGTVDEPNSQPDTAVAVALAPRLMQTLPTIQNEFFHLGSDLAFIEEDKHLNRLSDLLFGMARYENHQRGVPEPLWNTLA